MDVVDRSLIFCGGFEGDLLGICGEAPFAKDRKSGTNSQCLELYRTSYASPLDVLSNNRIL
jgi:hypothetical protein